MNIKEKAEVLGAREYLIDDDGGEKTWIIRANHALKLRIRLSDDELAVNKMKERMVRAIAKSMFIRAVLAGYDTGLDPRVRDEILKNKDQYLTALGVTIKREGEHTGELPPE